MRVRKFLSGNGDENSGGSLMRKSELNSVTRFSPLSRRNKSTYTNTQLCHAPSPSFAMSLRLPGPTFPWVFKVAAIDGRSERAGIRLRRRRLAARCSFARSLVEILEIWPIFVGGKFINRVNS